MIIITGCCFGRPRPLQPCSCTTSRLRLSPQKMALVASDFHQTGEKRVPWCVGLCFMGGSGGPAAETDTWLCCRSWLRLDGRLSHSDAAGCDDEDKGKGGNCDYLHG